ncbi:MAG: alpha/beta hydrolase [Gordonia sp. (in: high G+C Gram-positive bacteria)]|uniref:alpha/beta hydrolase n=1 Tax=Gordonia sp. (in: high G+C Gram-positive bacteria) TaxID=84139 RepID=UPI0039E3F45B
MSRATSVNLPPLAKLQSRAFRVAGRLPASVLGALGRFSEVNAAGDRLAPEMAVVGQAAGRLPWLSMTGGSPARARRALDVNSASMEQDFGPFAVEEDLTYDGPAGPLGATRYRAREGQPTGLVLFIHGGGFVVGSRASHDSAVRALAVASGADILSIEYRMAPEDPFPAAVDDCLAAWRFAVAAAPEWGIDPNRIVVSGDSAGGNLAAVIAQQTRGEAVVPRLQALIYPVTDMSGAETGSRREFASGYFLTKKDMDSFSDDYLPVESTRTDVRASPLLADDLSGLPPAYVIVAGFDPLRDEGIAYAEKLRAAGVLVTLERAGSMIHGFINMGLLSPDAREYTARIGAAIADGLSR